MILSFNSEFPQIQINREREVVLDEIDSYDDNPSELIYDDFEIYVLGTILVIIYLANHTLNSFNSDNVNSFVKRQSNFQDGLFLFR